MLSITVFRKGSTITLHGFASIAKLHVRDQPSARFFIGVIETQQGIPQHQPIVKEAYWWEFIAIKSVPFITFPIPPGSSTSSQYNSSCTHDNGRWWDWRFAAQRAGQFLGSWSWLNQRNMRLTSILQIPVKGSSQRNGRVTSRRRITCLPLPSTS